MPIPSVLIGFSGNILDAILHEYKPPEPIYDLTYGIGACWSKTCGKHKIISIDLLPFQNSVIADARHLPFHSIKTAFIDPPYAKIGNLNRYMHASIKNGIKMDDKQQHFERTSSIKNPKELENFLYWIGQELITTGCRFLIVKCGDSWLSIPDIYHCFSDFEKKSYLIAKQHGMRFNPSIKQGIIRSHTFWYVFQRP